MYGENIYVTILCTERHEHTLHTALAYRSVTMWCADAVCVHMWVGVWCMGSCQDTLSPSETEIVPHIVKGRLVARSMSSQRESDY